LLLEDPAGVLDVCGDVREGSLGYTEVLGENVARRVRKPVRNQERLVLREISVVKCKKELATLLQPLNRVRNPGWEIPQVACSDVVDKIAALRIDRRNARASGDHVGPLRLLVRMQFANAARLKTHVDASDRRCDRQLADRDFQSPAAGSKPVACHAVGEF
jgi:hypothetical protein